jgi:rhodanese-related sulfurtransferase
MASQVDARTLKAWLSDGGEIALLDVREAGQIGEGHIFQSVPLPYSRFERGLGRLVPNRGVRTALVDDGSGVSGRAAQRAEALGYTAIHILEGGTPAWETAGFTLFKGVNVPSKTFGELIEHARHTPRLTAVELKTRVERGDNLVILDGRPLTEHHRMTIPGSRCCPNGELPLRIGAIVPDPATTIVVNCAGRTRSIIGAQTLIDLGVPNPVFALENGTQGWFLAGFRLENGSSNRYPDERDASRAARAAEHAKRHGVRWIDGAKATAWLASPARTTYLFDVRTQEEFSAHTLPGAAHAPGGQLVQATDQWVVVRGARLLLADDDGVRAPMVAAWLRQMGHEAHVLENGIDAELSIAARPSPSLPALALIEPRELDSRIKAGTIRCLDLRGSMEYRKGHAAGAVWAIRPRLDRALGGWTGAVALFGGESVARAAALDLRELGITDITAGDFAAWRKAGLPIETSANEPPDAECIDYLFFTHDRHEGNAAAARQYLAWELGLLGQLDAQERGSFRI